jgi:surface antigen
MTFGINDYPNWPADTDDPHGFAGRQCASFANWRCINDFKIGSQHNLHGTINGGQFADFLGTKGYAVDGTPRVHDVVSLPPGVHGADPLHGHVAIVLAVHAGGKIDVEDYNFNEDRKYRQHQMAAAGCRFAHIQPSGASGALLLLGVESQ